MKLCSAIWNRIWRYLLLRPEEESIKEFSVNDLLQAAHKELQEAENLFARVEDEEMIDYAILNLRAAEKHYNYLLKAMKEQERAEKAADG